MRIQIAALFVLAVGLLNACSSVHVKPVISASDEGVRFYRSLPYLLVTAPLVIKSDPPELLRYNNDSNALVVVPVEEARPAKSSDGKSNQQVPSPGVNYRSGERPYGQATLAALVRPEAPPPPDVKKKDQMGLGAQVGQTAPAGPAGPGASTGKDSNPTPAPIAIVYLPDPCQEYTITQNNYLSSQTVGIMLNDGWQLSSLQSTSDNTGVVSSLIGAVGSALGGGGKGTGGGGGGSNTGGSKAQGEGPQLFIRTVTYTLTPGLYPLFQRNKDGKLSGCDGILQFVNPWDVKGGVRNVQITPLALQ